MVALEWIFWFSGGGLFFIYFVYPIVLLIVAKIKPKPIKKNPITPKVSVIIAAYNEENVIVEKIYNILASDYPKEKIEIIVSSDASTDRTNQIVQKIALNNENIHLITSTKRGGKAAALNRAVPNAQSEILIFTDANTEFDQSTIWNLVRYFSDEKVGGIAGRKVIYGKESNKEAEGFYWKYENFLKTQESLIHSCIGADGSIYAIRKELYCFPDQSRGYADDGMISMAVIAQGFRLIYEPEAKAYETASSSLYREYKRKIRTLSGGLEWMATLRKLLIPFQSPVWWQLCIHRLLRFSIPYLMILLFMTNILLFNKNYFYSITFFMQFIIYLFAFGAILGSTHKIFRIPFYFLFMNFAFVSALFRFLMRKSETRWEKYGRR